MTTSKVVQFTAALERQAKSLKLRVGRWHGGSRDTENLVLVEGGSSSRLLYIKDRSQDPGFWGLNENQLKRLKASGSDWCAVLLVGESENGYLVTSAEVERNSSNWSHSGSDFKVHEGPEILGSFRFTRFSDAFNRVTANLS